MATNKHIYLVFSLLLLGFAMIFPAKAQDNAQVITVDDTVTGEITDEAFEQFYTFEGTAGDIILISMSATGQGLDSYLKLLDANGNELYNNDDGGLGLNSLIGPYTIPETATYTIVATRYMQANGGSSGTYELTITMAELNTITAGETVTYVLDEEQPLVYFSYEAVEGETLRLVSTSPDSTLQDSPYSIYVTNPEGGWVNSGYTHTDGLLTIDPIYFGNGGSYLFSVNRELRYDNEGNPMAFTSPITVNITLESVTSQAIALGDTMEGVLEAGEADYYSFSAEQGTLARFTGNVIEGETPLEVQIYNTNGVSIMGASTGYEPNLYSFTIDPLRLDGGTEFLVIVRQNTSINLDSAAETTNYTVLVENTGTPIIESGVQVTGTVGGETFEQVYRFEGQGGQLVRIMLTSANQNYAPSISIDTSQPEDAQERQFYGYVMNMNTPLPGMINYEVLLPETGTYLIRINNGMPAENGSEIGQFNLLVDVLD